MPGSPVCEVSARPVGRGVLVRVVGELDLSTSPDLHRTLSGCARDQPVVVDLRAVSFLDTSAIYVLIAHHKRALGLRSTFAVCVSGAHAVEQLLNMVALDSVLSIVSTPELILTGEAEQQPSR